MYCASTRTPTGGNRYHRPVVARPQLLPFCPYILHVQYHRHSFCSLCRRQRQSTSCTVKPNMKAPGLLTALLLVGALFSICYAQGPGGRAALFTHNRYRARHGAPALTWDDRLARSAAAYAARCNFYHDRSNRNQGENLYASSGMDDEEELAAATKPWYDEIRLYNFNRPGFSRATGHFTQVVWRATRRIGCAARVCPRGINGFNKASRGTLVVCRYSPEGNVRGRFRANVRRPVQEASG